MKNFTIIVFISIALFSCGPSKEEVIIRETAKNDSIVKAAQEDLLKQQAEAEQQALLKQKLIDLTAQLAGAETKLQSIEEFKLLRTQNEKAQQVEGQTKVIEELKVQIEEVKKQIK